MTKTIKEERLKWVLPMVRGKIKLVNAAKVCPYSKRSVERWLVVYKKGGEESLEPKSTSSKTNPKEVTIRVKELVIVKRKKLKQCAQKLYWQLALEGTIIPVRTIGKILKQEGLTRKYRVRNKIQIHKSGTSARRTF